MTRQLTLTKKITPHGGGAGAKKEKAQQKESRTHQGKTLFFNQSRVFVLKDLITVLAAYGVTIYLRYITITTRTISLARQLSATSGIFPINPRFFLIS